MKTRTQGLVVGMSNRMNRLRMLANDKGFTLIELMIVIAIIGILAAVAIPNFIEYKNKSYCTATVNDTKAIGGALADYFANSANITVTTQYTKAAPPARPFITFGGPPPYDANTLLLSVSTVTDAGAYRVGSNYVVYACENGRNCPLKITDADSHWVKDPAAKPQERCTPGSTCCYFQTL